MGKLTMTIRTYQPGDETARRHLQRGGGGTAEVQDGHPRRGAARCRASDFDPGTRLYALEQGRPVAYVTFQTNGRVSLPWCRKGCELWAAPLFEQVLEAMRGRGLTRTFAAYRGDWSAAHDFFLAHGFDQGREMLNHVLDLIEMPTPAPRAGTSITPLTPGDLPALADMEQAQCASVREALEASSSATRITSRRHSSPCAIGAMARRWPSACWWPIPLTPPQRRSTP